jgi:hyperosmotically inducible periplasmic protein
MKVRSLGQALLAAGLLAGGLAQAANKSIPAVPGSDADLTSRVRHEILTYPRYTLWDEIDYRVANGQVQLSGAVTQPYKKSDIERLVKAIPGVTGIEDNVKVLPLSPMDDQLRQQVARAIFRDPNLSRYSMGAIPAIHIVVDNGHVTLAGVVMNEMDKEIAGMRAGSAGLSFGPVVNNLQVENAPHKS